MSSKLHSNTKEILVLQRTAMCLFFCDIFVFGQAIDLQRFNFEKVTKVTNLCEKPLVNQACNFCEVCEVFKKGFRTFGGGYPHNLLYIQ